jgi:chorismate mutase/prephenate dehydratase
MRKSKSARPGNPSLEATLMESADQILEKIRSLDAHIVRLLDARIQLARELGPRIEGQSGSNLNEVDARLMQHVSHLSLSNLSASDLIAIYRQIQSAFRLEAGLQPLSAACLGPVASFTHLAASTLFGRHCDYNLCDDIRQVFDAVAKRTSRYGVVAVANTIDGHVGENLDLLAEYQLPICREIAIPVEHCLLISGRIENVEEIKSHPQALGQCRKSISRLRERYPSLSNARVTETSSTSAAAKLSAADPKVAAIANRLAAAIWQLNIIEAHLEDDVQNMTRFVVIGHERPRPTKTDRTSISVRVHHSSGELVRTLTPIVKHDLNMTSLALRPARPILNKPWTYSAFVDIEGHSEDAAVRTALDEMAAVSGESPHILGSYPREIEM